MLIQMLRYGGCRLSQRPKLCAFCAILAQIN